MLYMVNGPKKPTSSFRPGSHIMVILPMRARKLSQHQWLTPTLAGTWDALQPVRGT